MQKSLNKILANQILQYIKTIIEVLNQDGGVEGRALTPSCENTRITTNC